MCALRGDQVTVRRARPTIEPLRRRPGLARASTAGGARLASATLARPDLVAPALDPCQSSPGPACRSSVRPARPRGITPARMSELTATLVPAASHTRLSSPRPPPILSYRQGPVSVWESAGRSGSATSGAFRAWRAFLSQQVSRWEYRLAGGKEPRPVRGVNWVRAVLPDGWLCSAPRWDTGSNLRQLNVLCARHSKVASRLLRVPWVHLALCGEVPLPRGAAWLGSQGSRVLDRPPQGRARYGTKARIASPVCPVDRYTPPSRHAADQARKASI